MQENSNTQDKTNSTIKEKVHLDLEEIKFRSSLSTTDDLEISIKVKNELLKFRVCNESCMNNFFDKTISSSELICLRTCTGKLNEVEKVIENFLSTKSTH
jgi:hypothetical protein